MLNQSWQKLCECYTLIYQRKIFFYLLAYLFHVIMTASQPTIKHHRKERKILTIFRYLNCGFYLALLLIIFLLIIFLLGPLPDFSISRCVIMGLRSIAVLDPLELSLADIDSSIFPVLPDDVLGRSPVDSRHLGGLVDTQIFFSHQPDKLSSSLHKTIGTSMSMTAYFLWPSFWPWELSVVCILPFEFYLIIEIN